MRKPVISIIDYGMGNIWSVSSAIEYLGFKSNILTAPEEIIMALDFTSGMVLFS